MVSILPSRLVIMPFSAVKGLSLPDSVRVAGYTPGGLLRRLSIGGAFALAVWQS